MIDRGPTGIGERKYILGCLRKALMNISIAMYIDAKLSGGVLSHFGRPVGAVFLRRGLGYAHEKHVGRNPIHSPIRRHLTPS